LKHCRTLAFACHAANLSSLSVTLLFGLPALRNSQPAVPPLGAFGDYLSFLWAEQIVAVSAVVMIWTWLVRERRASR